MAPATKAILTAAGLHLRAGYDWFYPYYRDRALCLTLGMTPLEMLLAAVGAKDDPNSGGRQMPSHWGHRKLNIPVPGKPDRHSVSPRNRLRGSWPVVRARHRNPRSRRSLPRDEITYLSIGEGATSEGEFWESLNTACTRSVPALYLVEDNGYAISVPVEVQTPGGDVSRLVESFPNLKVLRCDGTDFLASYRTMGEAVACVRRERKPAFVHAKVIRPYSHSLSDDERLYKTPDEREAESRRDPITRMRQFLLAEGVATQSDIDAIATDVDREIAEATATALAAPKPATETADWYVFSPDVDPDFVGVRDDRADRRQARHHGRRHQPHLERRDGDQPPHRRVWRGRRGREQVHLAAPCARQGRRLQGDPRSAAPVRFGPRIQFTAGRGQHHRARGRHGHPRFEAGG